MVFCCICICLRIWIFAFVKGVERVLVWCGCKFYFCVWVCLCLWICNFVCDFNFKMQIGVAPLAYWTWDWKHAAGLFLRCSDWTRILLGLDADLETCRRHVPTLLGLDAYVARIGRGGCLDWSRIFENLIFGYFWLINGIFSNIQFSRVWIFRHIWGFFRWRMSVFLIHHKGNAELGCIGNISWQTFYHPIGTWCEGIDEC